MKNTLETKAKLSMKCHAVKKDWVRIRATLHGGRALFGKKCYISTTKTLNSRNCTALMVRPWRDSDPYLQKEAGNYGKYAIIYPDKYGTAYLDLPIGHPLVHHLRWMTSCNFFEIITFNASVQINTGAYRILHKGQNLCKVHEVTGHDAFAKGPEDTHSTEEYIPSAKQEPLDKVPLAEPPQQHSALVEFEPKYGPTDFITMKAFGVSIEGALNEAQATAIAMAYFANK